MTERKPDFGSKDHDPKIRYGADSAALVERIRTGLGELDPRRIADLGAGSGMHALALAAAWPDALVAAYEPSDRMYGFLTANLAEEPRANLSIAQATASDVAKSEPGAFDVVLANLVGYFTGDLEGFHGQMAAVLRRGGIAVYTDFAMPASTAPEHVPFLEELFLTTFRRLGALRTQAAMEASFRSQALEILDMRTLPLSTAGPGLPDAVRAERARLFGDVVARFGLNPETAPLRPPALTWTLRRG